MLTAKKKIFLIGIIVTIYKTKIFFTNLGKNPFFIKIYKFYQFLLDKQTKILKLKYWLFLLFFKYFNFNILILRI